MRVRIKGVKWADKRLADGSKKRFYYHRATGARLPDDPNTAAFVAAIARLDEEVAAGPDRKPKRSEKTIAWLVDAYQRSSDWTRLAESTRTIEQFNIKAIVDKFGDMPLEAMREKGPRSDFLEWQDELAIKTPRAADAKLARLQRILKFGVEREHIDRNPIETFKRVYGNDRSDMLWLPEHVAAFSKVASPELRLALLLALHTGQRKGDLFALTWNQYDGQAITLRQSKTGTRVYIPCTRALKATLDATSRRAVQVLTNAEGAPWAPDAFRWRWDSAFTASGMTDDLHFHDLRGTAVTMLAEAGCSVPEIASITGHTFASANKILETYLARTRPLAEAAIAKLEGRMRG